MRKTRNSDAELIEWVETWLQHGRLCPKKSNILSYLELYLKRGGLSKAAMKKLCREAKESFTSIDARRDKRNFRLKHGVGSEKDQPFTSLLLYNHVLLQAMRQQRALPQVNL